MKKTSIKKLFKKLFTWALVMSFSLLFACLVLEIAFRFMGFGSLVIYQSDESLYWVPKPNQEVKTKIGGYPVTVNSQGTRGPEFEVPKPEGVFRILSIGDSRAFGWGLPEEKTYAKLLESKLNSSVGSDLGIRVEVINAGVNAWSYPQFKMFLKERGLAYEPDVVIVGDANLWMEFTESRSDEFRKAFKKRVVLKNLLRRSAIYHYVMESKFESFYQKHRNKAMPQVEEDFQRDDEKQARTSEDDPSHVYRPYIESIAEMITDSGAGCVLLHIPQQNHIHPSEEDEKRFVETFTPLNILELKREVAENSDAIFVDILPGFEMADGELFLESDPVHPNEKGSEIIAEELSRAITPLLNYKVKSK